jgi:hypothetical protein
MWWKEVESEGEVGAGEDCKGFDEDIGDGFVAVEVGVELVAEVFGRSVQIPSNEEDIQGL